MEFNKATFEKEVLKAVKLNHGGQLVTDLEKWRQINLKTFVGPAQRRNAIDVIHLWSLAANEHSLQVNLAELLAQPDFVFRLREWFEETQSLCSILSRLKKADLGTLGLFLGGLA